MKLSEKNPWELQHYRDALIEGHSMTYSEVKHRLAEVDNAIEESSARMVADMG